MGEKREIETQNVCWEHSNNNTRGENGIATSASLTALSSTQYRSRRGSFDSHAAAGMRCNARYAVLRREMQLNVNPTPHPLLLTDGHETGYA